MKKLFMETTEVLASKSAGEVSAELIRTGATQIATRYDQGKVIGLRWTMKVNGLDALFEMPARVEPIFEILWKRKGWSRGRNSDGKISTGTNGAVLYEKAERIAWRQSLRWVQAQNAMIETGMVQPMEVFTAYWVAPGQDRTLFENIFEKQFKALPPAQ